ncbi:MAG: SxtJ family membrane protein [Bacteroidetes bacterium]|nr:SxtJ family membrane protein [Bacteroidota bacterium]
MGKNVFIKFYSKWLAFARFLGRINTTLLLTLVYIFLIGPCALIVRLLRRDLLQKEVGRCTTFWQTKEGEPDSVERFYYQF